MVMVELTKRGYGVNWSSGDQRTYDLSSDWRGTIKRLQVKATNVKYKKKGACYRITCGMGRRSKKAYTKQHCDFIIAVCIPEHIFYVIPVGELGGMKKLSLGGQGKYERYKEAWGLLRR